MKIKFTRWDKADALTRFAAKVERLESGCWNWLAARDEYGYAVFTTAISKTGHQFAYESFRLPVPDGLELDHLCRNRGCVNPFHLEAVTTKTNVLRGNGLCAQNARKTKCPDGHNLSPINTYTDKNGSRSCRICRSKAQARYQQRKNQ